MLFTFCGYKETAMNQSESIAWRFIGPGGLDRFMTQSKYEKQPPGIQKWYEPFRCAACSTTNAQCKHDDDLFDDQTEVHIEADMPACEHNLVFMFPGQGKFDIYKCTKCLARVTIDWTRGR